MDRVTIGALVEDLIPFTEKGNKVTEVEIVPRSLVEAVINYCNVVVEYAEQSAGIVNDRDQGMVDMAKSVARYAKHLLKEFEEGES